MNLEGYSTAELFPRESKGEEVTKEIKISRDYGAKLVSCPNKSGRGKSLR